MCIRKQTKKKKRISPCAENMQSIQYTAYIIANVPTLHLVRNTVSFNIAFHGGKGLGLSGGSYLQLCEHTGFMLCKQTGGHFLEAHILHNTFDPSTF